MEAVPPPSTSFERLEDPVQETARSRLHLKQILFMLLAVGGCIALVILVGYQSAKNQHTEKPETGLSPSEPLPNGLNDGISVADGFEASKNAVIQTPLILVTASPPRLYIFAASSVLAAIFLVFLIAIISISIQTHASMENVSDLENQDKSDSLVEELEAEEEKKESGCCWVWGLLVGVAVAALVITIFVSKRSTPVDKEKKVMIK